MRIMLYWIDSCGLRYFETAENVVILTYFKLHITADSALKTQDMMFLLMDLYIL